MNKKTEIAHNYLEHLESEKIEKVIDLFGENGIVESSKKLRSFIEN